MHSLFLLSLLLLVLPRFTIAATTTVGVTYSSNTTTATTSAAANRIAGRITSMKIPAVRLPDSDISLIRSFAYTNVSLLLSIPNALVQPLAANRSLAKRWIFRHVLPYHPRSKISFISVGNDAVASSLFLVPAIRNVYYSLRDLGIRNVAVSTTFSFINIVSSAFPPSTAQFQQPVGDLIVKPLLQFLEETNSSFLVNIYPYNMYRSNPEIPIGFALFHEHPFNFRDDLTTGVRYRNLFDMMVDAVISAMAVIGHRNVPLVVAETGWPSSGVHPSEVDATPFYAEMYLKGLVKHLRSGMGTPLRKEGVVEAYIYELFDRGDARQGTKNWGILYQNMTKKYNLELSGGIRMVAGRLGGSLVGVFLEVVVLLLMF